MCLCVCSLDFLLAYRMLDVVPFTKLQRLGIVYAIFFARTYQSTGELCFTFTVWIMWNCETWSVFICLQCFESVTLFSELQSCFWNLNADLCEATSFLWVVFSCFQLKFYFYFFVLPFGGAGKLLNPNILIYFVCFLFPIVWVFLSPDFYQFCSSSKSYPCDCICYTASKKLISWCYSQCMIFRDSATVMCDFTRELFAFCRVRPCEM